MKEKEFRQPMVQVWLFYPVTWQIEHHIEAMMFVDVRVISACETNLFRYLDADTTDHVQLGNDLAYNYKQLTFSWPQYVDYKTCLLRLSTPLLYFAWISQ